MRRLTTAVVAGAIAITAAAACTGDDGGTAVPTDPCRAAIDEASAEAELRDQIALLDRALVVCASVETFTVNVERHPTLLGWDVDTYLSRRCATADETVQRSRVCTSDDVTPSTEPRIAAPEIVYVGRTLDGREVEIRPRPGRPFDDGVPRPIEEMTAIAERLGCDGVESEYQRWFEQVDDPVIGDEASVYAQHALNVLAFIGCETET